MNIDATIYAYQFKGEILCPDCTTRTLIARRDAAPAALDMDAEEVIEALLDANCVDPVEQNDSERWPQRLGAYSGLTEDDTCGNCHTRVYA